MRWLCLLGRRLGCNSRLHRPELLRDIFLHCAGIKVCPRKDRRGVDLISDVLPFGRLWYDKPDDAIGYAEHYSRAHDAVIRVYDESGNVIETHKHRGDFREW